MLSGSFRLNLQINTLAHNMVVFPNAKINLGLNVISKRTDGFHDIESVFLPVPWTDILEVVENKKYNVGQPKINLKLSGIEIPGSPEGNLCVKAFRLLDSSFDLPPLTIFLHKLIPMGAGLGGGSSDAAFFLKLMNEKFRLGLTHPQLMNYAIKLGSDCAFFLTNKPAHIAGKGEKIVPIDVGQKFIHYKVLIVYPSLFVPTVDAYRGIIPAIPHQPGLEIVLNTPLINWKENLKNDFEPVIFHQFPEIMEVKRLLYKHGATYASMSGSGSAVYGLFEKNTPDIDNLFPADYLIWKNE